MLPVTDEDIYSVCKSRSSRRPSFSCPSRAFYALFVFFTSSLLSPLSFLMPPSPTELRPMSDLAAGRRLVTDPSPPTDAPPRTCASRRIYAPQRTCAPRWTDAPRWTCAPRRPRAQAPALAVQNPGPNHSPDLPSPPPPRRVDVYFCKKCILKRMQPMHSWSR